VTTTGQRQAEFLLPAEAYWSPAWYEREQALLFGRQWNMVGTIEDVRDGQSLVAQVAGRTVTVRQDQDLQLVAWQVADPAGRQAPQPIKVATWGVYVFVHPQPETAPSLEDWLGDFPDRIGGFRPDLLVEVARHRFEMRANWKLFVENHIDVYHLWYLHADSLGAYDHHRASWDTCGPHWVFYEPPRPEVNLHGEEFWRGLLPIRHISEDRWGSGAHLIFPNVTLATGAGFFMTYQCFPVAPDRSVVDIRVRAEAGSDASDMLEMSRKVIEFEDGSACEAMQAAVASPWFSVGPLARDHELPITRFHESVLEGMGP
jgi:Rieske 2Fe-2S family protein